MESRVDSLKSFDNRAFDKLIYGFWILFAGKPASLTAFTLAFPAGPAGLGDSADLFQVAPVDIY